MKLARVGLLLETAAAERRWRYGLDCFGRYLGEILSHAGISYHWISDSQSLSREETDVVLVALAAEEQETAKALWTFAEQGGTVIAYGGIRMLAAKLGCLSATPLGIGYAVVADAGCRPEPLRFLQAEPWVAQGSQVPHEAVGLLRREKPDGAQAGTLLHRFRIGAGAIERFAVPIADTIVRMQQGIGPVLEDGIPAPDGTAQVNEGILKGDDAIAFDWEFDRRTTETGGKYFALPQADLWREALLRHLIRAAGGMGLTMPFLGYWPEGIRQVATISHDSDGNQDEHAEAALRLLTETGIRSTWCMLEPGYSPSIYDKVKEADHELAFHYNALDTQGGKWGRQEFERQLQWLRSAADLREVTSNKNHYTRFEGWSELFEWCEANGIVVDQTRGPSKKGNVGFLFGTCHPFIPISLFDEGNRFYSTWEIGFLTQDMDLGNWGDSSTIAPFLEQVAKVQGVAHFLFHQVHIHNVEAVREAFRKLVREAGSLGYTFMTSREIYEWHAARRKAKILGADANGQVLLQDAPEGTVVWIPELDPAAASEHGVERMYGMLCRKQIIRRGTGTR